MTCATSLPFSKWVLPIDVRVSPLPSKAFSAGKASAQPPCCSKSHGTFHAAFQALRVYGLPAPGPATGVQAAAPPAPLAPPEPLVPPAPSPAAPPAPPPA